jgi:DNA-binding transcriptional ArsR family regulator
VFADSNIAATSRALAEPTRAAMVLRMMDGQAHSASELAAAADLSPAAASAHLRHLLDAGLMAVRVAGRRKLHTLASAQVAAAIEALAAISPLLPVESLREARAGSHLKYARVCYSHLAGTLAVAITERLVTDTVIDRLVHGEPALLGTLDHPLLAALDITRLPAGAHPAVRGCVDWTEQIPHLAGRLGAEILSSMLNHGWIARRRSNRALRITETGSRQLAALNLAAEPPPRFHQDASARFG